MKSYKHTSTFSSHQINLFYVVRKVYFEVTSKRHRFFVFHLVKLDSYFRHAKSLFGKIKFVVFAMRPS